MYLLLFRDNRERERERGREIEGEIERDIDGEKERYGERVCLTQVEC